MQEKKIGVKRLLRSIENNVTDEVQIERLARLLNYDSRQLKEDIEAIDLVAILNKDEVPEQ